MYVLVASLLLSAALRGSGLVARALLRADLFATFFTLIRETVARDLAVPHRRKALLYRERAACDKATTILVWFVQ